MLRRFAPERAAGLALERTRGGRRAGWAPRHPVPRHPAPGRRRLRIRPARLADLPALVAIEDRCFESDRLSPRSFRHLLSKGNAAVIVAEREGAVRGAAVVLFQRGTSLARLYSIAVEPAWRGRGIGRRLVAASERAAVARAAACLRLEVRSDNPAAQLLYQRLGYRPFAVRTDYYEDHADAVRLQKWLATRAAPENLKG